MLRGGCRSRFDVMFLKRKAGKFSGVGIDEKGASAAFVMESIGNLAAVFADPANIYGAVSHHITS
ncbi:hypothetical protein BWQ93_05240 [Sphingopyxis sp. QXT-31]|uniref:hypothetical protein n=1 Tax=Sphingopyxis sp. QXT-31 TaxID=1357916 RepID=UPI0009796E63|nr:hypothetical protein [Sphingopyxis sp. QXT-31]APZ97956.1 hypothetical protein BWQ93_05240 [Sphingopyxis sp. QXT-31]